MTCSYSKLDTTMNLTSELRPFFLFVYTHLYTVLYSMMKSLVVYVAKYYPHVLKITQYHMWDKQEVTQHIPGMLNNLVCKIQWLMLTTCGHDQ